MISLGGGFARYSTDKLWKVPHFEKMLYDNAQLVSLYAEAYQQSKNPLYKQIVYETLDFIKREMTSTEGMFYSGLDADSEGEEGKFYVWTEDELKQILGERFDLFSGYFNINHHGLWENGNYILLRREDDNIIATKHGISSEKVQAEISTCKELLSGVRTKRVHPGIDDKSLTSWNALMAKGYIDAYLVFNESAFLVTAERNIGLLLSRCRMQDGGIYHSCKNGNATVAGFLEDYAFLMEALVGLYEATFNPKWLLGAKELADYTINHFYDDTTGMFFFTSGLSQQLIARKTEAYDNVIPSSNSAMAKTLFYLGNLLDNPPYLKISRQMLNNMRNHIATYPSGYSNWAILMLQHVYPYHEIAIAGKDTMTKRNELMQYYLPNKILMGTTDRDNAMADGGGNIPLLENKFIEGKTMIYVCKDKTCKKPVETIEEAVSQMNEYALH